jgi:hypothetical protein
MDSRGAGKGGSVGRALCFPSINLTQVSRSEE